MKSVMREQLGCERIEERGMRKKARGERVKESKMKENERKKVR